MLLTMAGIATLMGMLFGADTSTRLVYMFALVIVIATRSIVNAIDGVRDTITNIWGSGK